LTVVGAKSISFRFRRRATPSGENCTPLPCSSSSPQNFVLRGPLFRRSYERRLRGGPVSLVLENYAGSISRSSFLA